MTLELRKAATYKELWDKERKDENWGNLNICIKYHHELNTLLDTIICLGDEYDM